MLTNRDRIDADRYHFDFAICHPDAGWAQVDTPEDAWYFGTWANPTSLMITTYAEGDVTTRTCETAEEFVAEMRRIEAWTRENKGAPARIDPMLRDDIADAFRDLGLGDMLH